MPSLYQQMVGRTTRQDTKATAFANAIRKLSTSYKRVQKMDEVTKLKLKWAEENHNIAMANSAEKLRTAEIKREALETELDNIKADRMREQTQAKEAKSARGASIESFLKYQKSGGKEGREDLDAALVGLAQSDPDFSKALKSVVEGAVEAIQAPTEEKRGEALFELDKKLKEANIETTQAQAEQRRTSTELDVSRIRKEGFLGDRAQVEYQQALKELGAEAGESQQKRIQKAKSSVINDVYLEYDKFGGRKESRKRVQEERDNSIGSIVERRRGLISELSRLQNVVDEPNINNMINRVDSGSAIIEAIGKGGGEVTPRVKEIVDTLTGFGSQIESIRKNYQKEINGLDTVDNITNDLFDELVSDGEYSISEARAQLPEAVPEIMNHVKTIMDNVSTLKKGGHELEYKDYLGAYEVYLKDPKAPIKPIHEKLLKKALLKTAFQYEATAFDTINELYSTEK